jgi:hypothetical protein
MLFAATCLTLSMGVHAATVVTVTIGSVATDFEITTVRGPYFNMDVLLQDQPWWGDEDLADLLAVELAYQEGSPNPWAWNKSGPTFAHSEMPGSVLGSYYLACCGGANNVGHGLGSVKTYAVVSVAAVPLPAAGWLFMSALIGLVGKKRLSRR